MDGSPIELLDKLVGFETVSDSSNLALIHAVREMVAGYGIPVQVFENANGTKANLWATFGPEGQGGLVLSGHTDVVPTAGQDWTGDPFKLRETDGRLYGRGACDMKGFIAAVLSLVPELAANPPARPVHICLTHDEETDCSGIKAMAARFGKDLPQPMAAIIGEPTELQVVSSHKGVLEFEVAVTGNAGHSSMIQSGVSAIMNGARLISKLDQMGDELAEKPYADSQFDPPFSTIHVGLASGGTGANVIATKFDFTADIRNMPEDDPHAMLAEFKHWATQNVLSRMHRNDAATSINFSISCDIPALRHMAGSVAETVARQTTGNTDVKVVGFGSEAGVFQSAGVASVLLGPGSMRQGHIADEYVAIDQLQRCAPMLRELIQNWENL